MARTSCSASVWVRGPHRYWTHVNGTPHNAKCQSLADGSSNHPFQERVCIFMLRYRPSFFCLRNLDAPYLEKIWVWESHRPRTFGVRYSGPTGSVTHSLTILSMVCMAESSSLHSRMSFTGKSCS